MAKKHRAPLQTQKGDIALFSIDNWTTTALEMDNWQADLYPKHLDGLGKFDSAEYYRDEESHKYKISRSYCFEILMTFGVARASVQLSFEYGLSATDPSRQDAFKIFKSIEKFFQRGRA
jgi:hypothetical protein